VVRKNKSSYKQISTRI